MIWVFPTFFIIQDVVPVTVFISFQNISLNKPPLSPKILYIGLLAPLAAQQDPKKSPGYKPGLRYYFVIKKEALFAGVKSCNWGRAGTGLHDDMDVFFWTNHLYFLTLNL